MSYSLRTVRAFAVELQKLAADIQDADIQKLLAERRGEEYLDGGRLLTNTALEAEYARKMAAMGGYSAPLGLNPGAGTYDVLGSHKKKDSLYQKGRDYAGTALKGGLTGLGVLGAHNAMRGRFGTPSSAAAIRKATRAARGAAATGATVAIADRAYRYDDMPGQAKTAFTVSPNMNSSFRSPGASLAESGATGSFKSGPHTSMPAPKPIKLAKSFRLP